MVFRMQGWPPERKPEEDCEMCRWQKEITVMQVAYRAVDEFGAKKPEVVEWLKRVWR
jgi:hypothetical protein